MAVACKVRMGIIEGTHAAKSGADEDIRPCIGCMARVFNCRQVTCAVNPACFYEKSDPITPAMQKNI